jgi:serine/threonine protein kinase
MFNGNCVLADYGFIYHMSFDTETYCGTKGYASPQGWQDGRNYFKDWPYYKEKLSQVQADIYAIGSTFYECLKNEFMVDYKKYAKQDILNSFNTSPQSKYYSFYEYIFDKSYREVEGSLMYLMVSTRPDIAFAVGQLAKFMSNWGLRQIEAAKDLLLYLNGTRTVGITYGNGPQTLLLMFCRC